MSDPMISCPKCKTSIKLTDSLLAPLIDSATKLLEQEYAEKELQLQDRQQWLQEQENVLIQQNKDFDDLVKCKVSAERDLIFAEESSKAQLMFQQELAEKNNLLDYLQDVLKQREEKLSVASKNEVELLRRRQELDDAIREQDVKIEQRVQNSLNEIRANAKRAAEDELKLKIADRDLVIASMNKQIEDLKRKGEQGSQQLQGEVQEVNLESALKLKFVRDTIEPIAKGESGGDVIQRVFDQTSQFCGSILWESKRTKNWSDSWLAKVKDDSRTAEADVAIIVSQVLPKNIESFDCVDGVWILSPRYALPVGFLIRNSLLQIAASRQSNVRRDTKMEMVYDYLQSSSFRRLIECIVEKFTAMHYDLGREKALMQKNWAKREQQISRVIEATVRMYGDLQGIAGSILPEIDGLDVHCIEDESSEESSLPPSTS